jgi:hypothetical protein
MSMVCPQCSSSFEQRLQCPTCGVRLLFQARRSQPGDSGVFGGPQWQQTPWGRILVGLLLAQGLYHGLWQLCLAGLSVADTAVWTTLSGLVLAQGLQGLGLLVGGAMAGAGQRRGILFGTVVGVWNGMVFVLLLQINKEPVTQMALYGIPTLHTAFGAMGGWLGRLIWKPLPSLHLAGMDSGKGPRIRVPGIAKPWALSGPVSWGRVMAGAAVAVGGATWANVILEFVLEASEGKLKIESQLQAQLVSWEIIGLAVLVGSGLAGATTANGMKQGLFVGCFSCAALLALQMGNPKATLEKLVFITLLTLGLSLAGGWFGGQLFPPVVGSRRNKVWTAQA